MGFIFPMNIVRRSSKTPYEAGHNAGLDERADEVRRLRELLRRSANLFWMGQQTKDLFSTLTTKEQCEAEAGRILAEINQELLNE